MKKAMKAKTPHACAIHALRVAERNPSVRAIVYYDKGRSYEEFNCPAMAERFVMLARACRPTVLRKSMQVSVAQTGSFLGRADLKMMFMDISKRELLKEKRALNKNAVSHVERGLGETGSDLFGYTRKPMLSGKVSGRFCVGVELESRAEHGDLSALTPLQFYLRTGWMPTEDTSVKVEYKSPDLWVSHNYRILTKFPTEIQRVVNDSYHKERANNKTGGHISVFDPFGWEGFDESHCNLPLTRGVNYETYARNAIRYMDSLLYFPLLYAMYKRRSSSGYCEFAIGSRTALGFCGVNNGRIEHRYFPAHTNMKQMQNRIKLACMVDSNAAGLKRGMSMEEMKDKIFSTNNPILRLLRRSYSKENFLRLRDRFGTHQVPVNALNNRGAQQAQSMIDDFGYHLANIENTEVRDRFEDSVESWTSPRPLSTIR